MSLLIHDSVNSHSYLRTSKIFTFGYGNRRNYDSLLSAIHENSITHLVDIRLKPSAWTRRWYGTEIAKFCQSINIQYISMPCLGNTSGKPEWIPPDPKAAAEGLQRLSEISKHNSILLLCAELDYRSCHRTAVAESIQKLNNELVHHFGRS